MASVYAHFHGPLSGDQEVLDGPEVEAGIYLPNGSFGGYYQCDDDSAGGRCWDWKNQDG